MEKNLDFFSIINFRLLLLIYWGSISSLNFLYHKKLGEFYNLFNKK